MKLNARRRKAAKDVLAWSKRVCPEKMLWQCSFDEGVSHRLRVMLEASIKREEVLDRKLAAKPKPKPCAKCKNRRQMNLVRKINPSKEKPAAENVKAIITNIVEYWPQFKNVPWLQWNLYLDATGTCRCGRKIAPQRILIGARTCCDQCQELKKQSKKMRRLILKSQQRKQIAEAMDQEYE